MWRRPSTLTDGHLTVMEARLMNAVTRNPAGERAAQASTALDAVALLPGLFDARRQLNRRYLLSLSVENLLQNHRLEAGIGRSGILRGDMTAGDDRHWGWETPGSPMRGHFVGHWLSAAAREVAVTHDAELRARVDAVVRGLEECQNENGDGWVFGISPRLFHRLAAGKAVWAPQYVAHKTLMGLVDVVRDLGDRRALKIAVNAASWFDAWSSGMDRERFTDLLDIETGGMIEVWADLLELCADGPSANDVAGVELFARLLERYRHSRFFDPLVAGHDVLTNGHANTTIPEVLGAARAYEVTGDARWRAVVEAYWRSAVTDRGAFCTGGQSAGEIWTPPFEFAARRGDKNQEHCVVYNMIRLADVLFRWTGDVEYLDYIEANTLNGILAQQHPDTGMVAYFLPLAGGARKNWGSPTEHFWCCHGTLVQAHTRHSSTIYYEAEQSITVAQYIPSTLATVAGGVPVTIELETGDDMTDVAGGGGSSAGSRHRPQAWNIRLKVTAERAVRTTIRLRVPGWVVGEPVLHVNGTPVEPVSQHGFIELRQEWQDDEIQLRLPVGIRAVGIPDEPETVAFACGPVVLAGECDAEVTIDLRGGSAVDLIRPHNERQWTQWLSGWRIVGQDVSIQLRPLYEIADESYSVYFPTR
jgi:DUF1680 family protein